MNTQQLNAMGMLAMSVKLDKRFEKSFNFNVLTPNCPKIETKKVELSPGKADGFFLDNIKNSQEGEIVYFEQTIAKSKTSDPIVQLLVNIKTVNMVKFIDTASGEVVKRLKKSSSSIGELIEVAPKQYSIFADEKKVGDVNVKTGGVYNLIISEWKESIDLKLIEISQPNSMHMVRIEFAFFNVRALNKKINI